MLESENMAPAYPEYPRRCQPLLTSHVSSDIQVDDFNPQGDATFGDVWKSNNSLDPSKSTSYKSQIFQECVSSEQVQQQSIMSDPYDFVIPSDE